MKPILARKYREKTGRNVSALVKRNPVMLLSVSIPFVIATAISLKFAVAMTLEMFIINVVTVVVAAFTARALEMWKRVLVNVGAATVVMMLTRALITRMFPDISNFLGTYIYLMALNGMVILQVEEGRSVGPSLTLRELGQSLRGAVVHSLVFGLIMVAVSAFREYLGAGTLWGYPLPTVAKLQGAQLPFFGFVSVGFLLALIKFLSKKIAFANAVEKARREARDRDRYTQIHIDTTGE